MEPRLVRFLGCVIDRWGNQIPFNTLIEMVYSGKDVSQKTIQNDKSALNSVLRDVHFPWELHIKEGAVRVRKA